MGNVQELDVDAVKLCCEFLSRINVSSLCPDMKFWINYEGAPVIEWRWYNDKGRLDRLFTLWFYSDKSCKFTILKDDEELPRSGYVEAERMLKYLKPVMKDLGIISG